MKVCRNWTATGECRFGDRCHFVHELAQESKKEDYIGNDEKQGNESDRPDTKDMSIEGE